MKTRRFRFPSRARATAAVLSAFAAILLLAPAAAPAFPFGTLVYAAGSIDHPHNRKQLIWTIPSGRWNPKRDTMDQYIYERSTNEVHGCSSFSIGIVPGVSIPEEDWDVLLLRVNLPAGRHRSVSFVDVGLVANEVDGQSIGLQLSGIWNRNLGSPGQFQIAGAANACDGWFYGWQCAGAVNLTAGRFEGWQCAGLANLAGSEFYGWQCAGLVNLARGDFEGWQFAGLLNYAEGGAEGLQTGLVNAAERLDGVQIGVFNWAWSGSGVQIGAFNWAQSFAGVQIGVGNVIVDAPVPFLPFVNASF